MSFLTRDWWASPFEREIPFRYLAFVKYCGSSVGSLMRTFPKLSRGDNSAIVLLTAGKSVRGRNPANNFTQPSVDLSFYAFLEISSA